jgi:peptidoglycan lytic transglycosylase
MKGTERKRSAVTGKALLFILAALFLISSFNGSPASAADEAKNLGEGKRDFDAGHFKDAINKLSAARKDFPLLGDYALFYLSESYRNTGDHGKALETARALLGQYPDSPLVRKARTVEARESREISGQNALKIYEKLVADYPDDEEASFTYGCLLKLAGETVKADEVFRKVYIMAGPHSDKALAALSVKDIGPAALVERATNLMRRCQYKEAELDLRKALSLDSGTDREDILRSLGSALFRQREYKESSAVYGEIDDLYDRARALYRAGDKEGFSTVLDDLLAGKDRRAGELLIAFASGKRRDGDFGGALKIYNAVLEKFPFDAEDAMWEIGWTDYISSDYRKSAGIFSRLYAKYDNPKYLYWKARSLDALGEDTKGLYADLSKTGNNYYGAIASARIGGKLASTAPGKEPDFAPPSDRRGVERAEALLSLGMTSEAVTELTCLAVKVESPSAVNYVISRLLKLGQYRKAIGMATRGRYSEDLHGFWYPLAYWDDVEPISKRQGIDPFILLAVMREESRFDAGAKSVAGARGLMQIMPKTAYRLDKSLKLGISRDSDIHDARNNITLGAFYLKSLFSEFGSFAHVLSAYNAGEAVTKKWEQQGSYKSDDEFVEDIPYAETRNYVKKVITSYFEYRRSAPSDLSGPGLDIILGKI